MVLARTREAGYAADSVGENIARGQRSVEEVMEGWMASPEHKKNILDPKFTEAGFGVALGKMPGGRRGALGSGLRQAAGGSPRASSSDRTRSARHERDVLGKDPALHPDDPLSRELALILARPRRAPP